MLISLGKNKLIEINKYVQITIVYTKYISRSKHGSGIFKDSLSTVYLKDIWINWLIYFS